MDRLSYRSAYPQSAGHRESAAWRCCPRTIRGAATEHAQRACGIPPRAIVARAANGHAECRTERRGRSTHRRVSLRAERGKRAIEQRALDFDQLGSAGRQGDVEEGPTTPHITPARTMASQAALASSLPGNKSRDKSFRGQFLRDLAGDPNGQCARGSDAPSD